MIQIHALAASPPIAVRLYGGRAVPSCLPVAKVP